MCGLYGFLSYSNTNSKGLCTLTNALAEQSAVRGVDATGIAFCKSGGITIQKEPKSAYNIDFKHPENISAMIGHTRHSTQGDEKKNFNNHPFYGKSNGIRFALAHNGVLTNDNELRNILHLPKTKIETDSFVAVQLIESQKAFDIDSIRYMAEQVQGSFSFSILDDRNNIYLVKGDSPLVIFWFPKQKIYVYASTEPILFKALVDTMLFETLKHGDYEEILIDNGEIVKILPNGKIERHQFHYHYNNIKGWWEYGYGCYGQISNETIDTYINEIKSVAQLQGISQSIVNELLENGFTLEEVEDYIYEYSY